MVQKTLQEMDNNTFLAKVDVLMEHLERQASDDPVSGWAVSQIKAEIRRRILEHGDLREVKLSGTPIAVEIERLSLNAVIQQDLCDIFNGDAYNISLTGVSLKPCVGESAKRTIVQGFFSEAEADAYLCGLRTAREFGLPLEGILDIEDVPEEDVSPDDSGTE